VGRKVTEIVQELPGFSTRPVQLSLVSTNSSLPVETATTVADRALLALIPSCRCIDPPGMTEPK
jgi:hypothetical protein